MAALVLLIPIIACIGGWISWKIALLICIVILVGCYICASITTYREENPKKEYFEKYKVNCKKE